MHARRAPLGASTHGSAVTSPNVLGWRAFATKADRVRCCGSASSGRGDDLTRPAKRAAMTCDENRFAICDANCSFSGHLALSDRSPDDES
jgi:hypothetical protein